MIEKDMIRIYFPWVGKKYPNTLGNPWKLVSHIWELRGFYNSIDFSSKPIVWEYNSFSHNIPIIWNLHYPYSVDCLGFVITSNLLKIPQPGSDMAFHGTFPFYGNLYIPRHCELHGFSLFIVVAKIMGNPCVSPYFSRTK